MKHKSKWKMLLVGATLAMAMLLAGNFNALANDYTCIGTVGAITVDDLRVPQNATCTLNGTQVDGNIFVENNATLLADDVHVNGNIQAENAARVNVYPGSFVGGNIQIKQSGAADIHGVDIHGELYFDDNDLFLNAANNTIGGNLQAFQNTGGVSIISNTIGANLQCKENVPPPTGGGNIVDGNMEDQCKNFGGDPSPAPTPTTPAPTPTHPPSDHDYTCTGYVGAITVDDLRVLQQHHLHPDRHAGGRQYLCENNATLLADDVHVNGNIQAENAARVNVYPGSFVGGNIQIKQSGAADIHGVDIHGELYFDDNDLFLNAANNTIGGNLQAFQNTGGVSIISNTIGSQLAVQGECPTSNRRGQYRRWQHGGSVQKLWRGSTTGALTCPPIPSLARWSDI